MLTAFGAYFIAGIENRSKVIVNNMTVNDIKSFLSKNQVT